MDQFLISLMQKAQEAGLEACEAYLVERDSFRAVSTEGEITEYKSNKTKGLGFRGLKNGHMGYASTEAFDEDAVNQLVKGALESAELCEDDSEVFLYEGNDEVPVLNLCDERLADIAPDEKIDNLLKMEAACKAQDARIDRTARQTIQTGCYTIRIVNSFGMDRSYTMNMSAMYGEATARDGESKASGFYGTAARTFDQLDAQATGSEMARRAVSNLNAHPVPSGRYRVIFQNDAMCDLLSTFCGIFSAEIAQKGLSLLKGRLGETIAAPCVTLVDDPLLADGLASRPFDDEGVASSAHVLVENGMFKTFLHNLKTARKDGVTTTGNASKAGYASSVHVAPSNLFFKAGEKTFDEMLSDVKEGIVITELSGLHAGANAVSGDFSLLSKGYVFRNGRRGEAVEQITVAGNFYELLKSIRQMANDLVFPMGGVGCPSVDAGELSVSGC